ncbi:MAG TPA: hypothetical protein V6C95_06520 [Coleofasciculaceae cyanobacterium]
MVSVPFFEWTGGRSLLLLGRSPFVFFFLWRPVGLEVASQARCFASGCGAVYHLQRFYYLLDTSIAIW